MREAYGEFVAFIYGWMIFTVSCGAPSPRWLPGLHFTWAACSLHSMPAQIVATFGPFELTRGHLVAIAAIAFQTVINIFGVRWGAVLQNLATWMKFAAIAAFVLLGLTIGKGSWSHYSSVIPATSTSPSMLAGVGSR